MRSTAGKARLAVERYTKAEIMEMLDVGHEALRHWERSGLIDYPRNENRRIYFTTAELRRLCLISALRAGGQPVTAISDILGQIDEGAVAAKIGDPYNPPGDLENFFNAASKILDSFNEAIENYPKIRDSINRLKKLREEI